ncbi:MAG: Efflux ABC transporter, permease/ATP-binding protein [uncultured Thermomicrobiales bacterium]|uniref:Efflux ABC transporter, permease/ATP-binding protein n=1 Tax=uncultured Thermomicrobiales bacterium TaxID=1645740 RepID=A0A6J4VNN8_9BACT|nr:MAG: Efflux ABC transporter, permease/ATP-binding protein [uncultured Thermomicrobiales bacterium]
MHDPHGFSSPPTNGRSPNGRSRSTGRSPASRGSETSEGVAPEPTGPRWRIDRGALWNGVRSTWRSTVRVFELVWSASRHLTLGLAVATLVQSLTPAAQVWLAGQLIQAVADGIAAAPTERQVFVDRLIWLAVIQLGLLLVSGLFQTLGNVCQQLLQEKLAVHVQLQIMAHAATLDLADFEHAVYYDQLQQAQRESANRPVQMVSQVFGLGRSLVTFATLLALLLGLGPLVAAATLLAPIPAFISGSRYGWWGFQQMRRQSPQRRLMGYLTTLLTTDEYAKEIKLFTLGDYFIRRYKGVADDYLAATRSLLLRRYWLGFAWGTLTTLASSGTYLYVALRAVAGSISLGQLTVFAGAATQVGGAFQGILGGVQGIYEHGLYLSTLYELLERQPRIAAPANPAPLRRPFRKGIEFRDVSYRYPGRDEPALDHVSFTIAPGETVALVGRNGAGKSTVVKLLGRLYDPDQGTVLIDGRDVRDYDPAELRRRFAVMFQDYAAFQLSAGENIGVGDIARVGDSESVQRAAAEAGADSVIGNLPDGFATTLGKWFDGGHQLSGGEWQKVALARAFMRDARDAEILILDEPTAALDAKAEHDLFARLNALTEGRMALYISHRFSTVRMADRILVLENGRLIEQGTHEALMLHAGRYAELFELQAASYR